MKIIVLGGDGFCGWPTALHLSARGHDVIIVDNLSRRKIDVELEVNSLTPIRPLGERVKAWHELTNHTIRVENFTVGKHYHRLLTLLRTITAEDVQAVAAKYFGDDQLTIATLLPQPLEGARKRPAPAAGARH